MLGWWNLRGRVELSTLTSSDATPLVARQQFCLLANDHEVRRDGGDSGESRAMLIHDPRRLLDKMFLLPARDHQHKGIIISENTCPPNAQITHNERQNILSGTPSAVTTSASSTAEL